MDATIRVPRGFDDVTREWVEQALGRPVPEIERIEIVSTCSTHVRLRVCPTDDTVPLQLRVKIGSAATFGREEVDYYLRYFVGLDGAPLVRCHHAAADATHDRLLHDDPADTYRNQFDVVPTERYGHALVEAVARLHAHRWLQPPPEPAAFPRALAPAWAGLGTMLDAMAVGFSVSEGDRVRALFDSHPGALRIRLADPHGFTAKGRSGSQAYHTAGVTEQTGYRRDGGVAAAPRPKLARSDFYSRAWYTTTQLRMVS